jgi:hypothetical protein
MRKISWPLIVLALLITLLYWQYTSKKDVTSGFKDQKVLTGSSESFTYEIIPGHNKTWGYDILSCKKLIIHQPCIPAVEGNDGFKTREAAENVAKLVIEKMKKGEMPPSIDAEEMKKLKAI